jgi:CheY-like chemotaxis protein
VLLVDDDEVIRHTLREWLEDEGYVVWEAADGIEALYLLDHLDSPDAAVVIVTDYSMPRLDGRGLLDFVRLNPEIAKRSAFIYMTASERIISPMLASDLQTAEIPLLRKPFDLATLTRVVNDAQARLRPGSDGAHVASRALQDKQEGQDPSAGQD